MASPFDVVAAERRIADAERPALERARATRIEAARVQWVRNAFDDEGVPEWMHRARGRVRPDRLDLPSRTLASMLREVRMVPVGGDKGRV